MSVPRFNIVFIMTLYHERILIFCNEYCNLNDREEQTPDVKISCVITTLDFFADHLNSRDTKEEVSSAL